MFPGAKYDGVFGMWYGKGPGVDRCGDVFKHGNSAGTSKHGGVLVLAGDDHAAKSSTLAHQSEHILKACCIPVLNPASVQDYLDFGLHGFAMSRFAGCWVGFKCVTDVVESRRLGRTSIRERVQVKLPTDFALPPGGLNIRWPDSFLEQEMRLLDWKVYAALAYVRANGLDRIVWDSPGATPRHHHHRQELRRHHAGARRPRHRRARRARHRPARLQGRDDLAAGAAGRAPLRRRGWRKSWWSRKSASSSSTRSRKSSTPGKPASARRAWSASSTTTANGATPRASPRAPGCCRRTTSTTRRSSRARSRSGSTSWAWRSAGRQFKERLAFLDAKEKALAKPRAATVRQPYFCSGCPHNTSTRVPEGSRATAGIGCHFMAVWMDRNTSTFTHMGGEGAPWIGQAPFTEEKHIFANLGDGTYFHSGLMAIRAAVAAKVTMTYKILYNDAVAMTGGQHARRPARPGDDLAPDRRRGREAASSSSPTSRTSTPPAPTGRRASPSATATSSTPCSASCASCRASPR